MKILKISLAVLCAVFLITALWKFIIPVADITTKLAVAQEKQNSQLLENTCDKIEYKGINCKQYKELVNELDNLNMPTIKYQDILCVSTAALSIQLPPLTPSIISDAIVKKITNKKVLDCDTEKALKSLGKSMNEYQKLKGAVKIK